ncbi:MAG: cobalt-precorrin-5B (C(1))-methyltransferase [Commensalibacter sp.]
MKQEAGKILKYGWTTGSCATAAAKAAYHALCHGDFPDPVQITLPQGRQVHFALANKGQILNDCAKAAIVKDAGDDPDITHGALIWAQIRKISKGSGILFKAGKGVGVITRPGLALAVGEPAINPVPRQMIRRALMEVNPLPDVEVTIGVENGEILAKQTLNPRLGILGGLSILGTTGIVVPYSCAAWIASIHHGIDVARAMGLNHLIASTGNVSEQSAQNLYHLPEPALIEMGDFAGGVLKYLCSHPVERLTLAGGVAKMTKLAQGHLDLHSSRSQVDLKALADLSRHLGAETNLVAAIEQANTAAHAFELAQHAKLPLGNAVAKQAWDQARSILKSSTIDLEVLLFDRKGMCQGKASFST